MTRHLAAWFAGIAAALILGATMGGALVVALGITGPSYREASEQCREVAAGVERTGDWLERLEGTQDTLMASAGWMRARQPRTPAGSGAAAP